MIYIFDGKETNKLVTLKGIKTIVKLELFDIIEIDLKTNSKEELVYNLPDKYVSVIKSLFAQRGLEPTTVDICKTLDCAEQFIREY